MTKKRVENLSASHGEGAETEGTEEAMIGHLRLHRAELMMIVILATVEGYLAVRGKQP